jgi:hypothetical protein
MWAQHAASGARPTEPCILPVDTANAQENGSRSAWVVCRCGGQGYLSCNRFGGIIGFAHATVTAEGDNRVLMQKVAKELIGMAAKDPGTRARLQAALSSTRPVRNNFVPSRSARMFESVHGL